jgi:hypothetical protein
MNPAVSLKPTPVSAWRGATTTPVTPAPGRQHHLSIPVCLAADQRPAFDGTPVAGLPVGVFGFQDEAGIDDKMQRGFILKADVNGMVLAGSKDFDKINGLAFDLFKAIERTPAVTADRRLASLGLGKAQRFRNALSFLWFFGVVMFA